MKTTKAKAAIVKTNIQLLPTVYILTIASFGYVSTKKVEIIGADEGIRTLDIRLGRTALYQLSYIRKLAPQDGFEPPTRRLTVVCSTTELLGNKLAVLFTCTIAGGYHKPLRNMVQQTVLLVIGIPSRIRTSTSGFGDRYAAVNTKGTKNGAGERVRTADHFVGNEELYH